MGKGGVSGVLLSFRIRKPCQIHGERESYQGEGGRHNFFKVFLVVFGSHFRGGKKLHTEGGGKKMLEKVAGAGGQTNI